MSQTVKTAISGTQKCLKKTLSSLIFLLFSLLFFFESRVILAGLSHKRFDSLWGDPRVEK